MPRPIAYVPFYTDRTTPQSLVSSCDIGLSLMDPDFIYGVRGRPERQFLDCTMSMKKAREGQILRRAKICLDVEYKYQGAFDPLTGLKDLRFFAGEDERIDVQAAVGSLWLAVAQEEMRAHGIDYRQLPRKIDFRRAREYMRALPQHAAEVARRANFIGLSINCKLFGHDQWPRVIMIQRRLAREAVKWAEFEDHLSSVTLEVPAAEGSQILELARMPKLQWHYEERPTQIVGSSPRQ